MKQAKKIKCLCKIAKKETLRYNKIGGKMNKQKQLTVARGIFAFLVFIAFGVIIVTEKAGDLLIPRAKEKMETYLSENYSSIKGSLILNKVTYKNLKYKAKVTSKKNKNHFFYIYYSKRKTTDTYKKDYLKGNQLLKSIKINLNKEIKTKTNISTNVEIISDLDKYTKKVQERIITEENLSTLKFYYIKKELLIENWTTKEITQEITSLINSINSKNITPKYYEITITNKEDITESIKISNLTEKFLTNKYQEQIINDIINDSNSLILKQNKITYKYLN